MYSHVKQLLAIVFGALVFQGDIASACVWGGSEPFFLEGSNAYEGWTEAHQDRERMPQVEILAVRTNRSEFTGSSCDGLASMEIDLQLVGGQGQDTEDYGFYFVVIEGDLDRASIFPNLPMRDDGPRLVQDGQDFIWEDWPLGRARLSLGRIEGPLEASESIDMEVLVFAVNESLAIGHPTRFTVHRDPAAAGD